MKTAQLKNTPSPETILDWDRTHQFHPWASMDDVEGSDYMLVNKGKGIYLWDETGKRFIDGPGGMWCVQIGYGRPEMAEAIAQQVMKLPYSSPWTNTTEPSAVLAKKIADMAPGDLNNVFFTTGGSTAVDTALRTVHFMNNRLGRPDKKIILAREKGYHGSTYLVASVTGKERDKSRFDIEKRLVHFLPDVNPYRRPEGMSVSDWCDAKVSDLEKAIADIGAENIGGFIAEPILCSGGVIVPPTGYHQRTFEICRKHDILYISDEVVTAFGRLGHWFASQDVFGIEPDIITCAKGMTSGYLPLGACIVSDRVMERMVNANDAALFSVGYTYSAHPVCVLRLSRILRSWNRNIFWSMCVTFPLISKHVFRLWPIFPVLEMCAAWDCWAVSKARPTQTVRHWKRNVSWGLCWMLPAKSADFWCAP